MWLRPKMLGSTEITAEELAADKKKCRRFGPCGVGEKALYLNSFYIERMYYAAFPDIVRVFKRVAMSKGGFTGRGVFASIPYLVVQFADGREKQCNFKDESQVDRMLAYLAQTHPELPLHSEAAEKLLVEKEKVLEEKKAKLASAKAVDEIRDLENFRRYLDGKAELSADVSAAAKQKRTFERSNPAYKWVALTIMIMGALAVLYGIWALLHHEGLAMYFLLFGMAAVFLFSGAQVLPTGRNNRNFVEKQWAEALASIESYVKAYPDAPLPASYAHPGVIRRMEEILADERASTIPEALQVLKEDLKKLNSSVEVEQEEFDEIMTIKPIFLVMDYR